MRFVLGINTLHCSNYKTRRGLELSIRLFRLAFVSLPPSVQYRRMSTCCGEGFTSIEPWSIQGKRGEVSTRKRR